MEGVFYPVMYTSTTFDDDDQFYFEENDELMEEDSGSVKNRRGYALSYSPGNAMSCKAVPSEFVYIHSLLL